MSNLGQQSSAKATTTDTQPVNNELNQSPSSEDNSSVSFSTNTNNKQASLSETAQAIALLPSARNQQQAFSQYVSQHGNSNQIARILARSIKDAQLQNSLQRKTTEESHQEPVSKNNTGLPDNLKSGVEQLSGISLDEVSVKYNSDKPAQLGALAYTEGTDIHIGPGQERHLPHEAWHVVQQAQGRVQSTVQLKEPINDDEELEQEADVMGAKALAFSSLSTEPTKEILANSGSIPKKVKQLIATQITLNSGKIAQVNVRGRPERVFTNSMGDHTTAFIVHQEGLIVALQGKTIPQALAEMVKLGKALSGLPGFELMQKEKDKSEGSKKIVVRFNYEYTVLKNSLDQLARSDLSIDLQVNHLQNAVDAYLSARELVPFSTINVSEKTQGKAGHGKGESGPASVLSTFERGHGAELSDKDLTDAVYKLFDYYSAATLSATQSPEITSKLTAGFSVNSDGFKTPQERVNKIWEQHLRSIAATFPKAFAKIGKDLQATKALDVMAKMIGEEFLIRAKNIKNEIDKAERSYLNINQPEKYLNGKGDIIASRVENLVEINRNEAKILQLLTEMRQFNKIANDKYTAELQQAENSVQKYVDETASKRTKKSKELDENLNKYVTKQMGTLWTAKGKEGTLNNNSLENIQTAKSFAQGSVLENFKKNDYKVAPKEIDKAAEKAIEVSEGRKKALAEKNKTLVSEQLPMAIQIKLDDKGNIVRMISSGRPASPFKGTMGAHSTAWVAHLDRVERRIIGKTPVEAITEMQKLAVEVLKFANSRTAKYPQHIQAVYVSKGRELQAMSKKSLPKGSISDLQLLINTLLSYYNLIPGVTRAKNDTGGKGEGTYRRTLRNYELYGIGSKAGLSDEILMKELTEAANSLYDSTARSGEMWDNHKTIIKQAYPAAAGFIFDKAKRKEEKPAPKSVEIGSTGDEGEEDEVFQPLDENSVKDLAEKSKDSNWLWGVNNCLINAITDAAGVARATAEQVIAIRTDIGAAAGEMLFASPRILDIVLRRLNLLARGVMVLNFGSNYIDTSTVVSDNPLYIYHNGVNHFDALPAAQIPKKSEEPSKPASDPTKPKVEASSSSDKVVAMADDAIEEDEDRGRKRVKTESGAATAAAKESPEPERAKSKKRKKRSRR